MVCTANLVRSPVAEAALVAGCKRLGVADFEFSSAGVSALPGHPVPAELIQAIRPFFLDLHRHRSRRVTRKDVRDSALVLAMSEDQREALRAMSPAATPRIFTLPEFARLVVHTPKLPELDGDVGAFVHSVHRERPRHPQPRDAEDIQDAYGGTAKQYSACIAEIVRLVDQVIGRLA